METIYYAALTKSIELAKIREEIINTASEEEIYNIFLDSYLHLILFDDNFYLKKIIIYS